MKGSLMTGDIEEDEDHMALTDTTLSMHLSMGKLTA